MNYDLAKRKDFILWAHATTCFENAVFACDEIERSCKSEDSQLFKALSQYAVIEYSKPFKNNRGIGKLPVVYVPEKKIPLHKQNLQLRDKMFAHVDCEDGADDDVQNPVRVEVTSRMINFLVADTRIPLAGIATLRDLAEIMMKKAHHHTTKHIKALSGGGRHLAKGVYSVDLADNDGPPLRRIDDVGFAGPAWKT